MPPAARTGTGRVRGGTAGAGGGGGEGRAERGGHLSHGPAAHPPVRATGARMERGRGGDVPAVALDVDPGRAGQGGQGGAAGVAVVQVPAAPAGRHGGGRGHQVPVELAAVARVDIDHAQARGGPGADGQQAPAHLAEHGGEPGRVEGGGVEAVTGQAAAPGPVVPGSGGPARSAVGHRPFGPAQHEHRPAVLHVPARGSLDSEPRRGLLALFGLARRAGWALAAPAQAGRAVPAGVGFGPSGEGGRGVRGAAVPGGVEASRRRPAGAVVLKLPARVAGAGHRVPSR